MRVETAHKQVMGAYVRVSPLDAAIAALAQRQHGVVARAQLVGLGLGRGAIGHRLECGRLHPLHRGVYAVGYRALSREARWIAAVLASGPGAVLSHRSAAALWGLRVATGVRADVTVPRKLESRTGIAPHHAVLAPDEVTVVRGIPVTTSARTLLDLAGAVAPRHLERAINDAEVLRLADALSLDELVRRHPRRRGVAALRRILADGRVGATVTRSELEDRFLPFLDRERIPRPEVNAPLRLGGSWIEADCMWRAQRLVVELDGYATHATRAAFDHDRARDRALQAAGWRVVRVTWRHLADKPATLAAQLRALLA
jgi:predicted transcriptional regulator of viral defense system